MFSSQLLKSFYPLTLAKNAHLFVSSVLLILLPSNLSNVDIKVYKIQNCISLAVSKNCVCPFLYFYLTSEFLCIHVRFDVCLHVCN